MSSLYDSAVACRISRQENAFCSVLAVWFSFSMF